MFFLDHTCHRCQMGSQVKSPCLQGRGNPDTAKLLVYTDYPMYIDDLTGRPYQSDGARLLLNLFERMGVWPERDVYFDYTLKCGNSKKVPKQKCDRLVCYEACSHWKFATLQNLPNVVGCVVMGKLSLEMLNGSSDLGKYEGECWMPRELPMRNRFPQVWVTYSPAYLIEKPAEIPNVYRILFTAAMEVGLEPYANLKAPHFNWEEVNKK